MTIKRALERVPVDPAAEERAWAVVEAAFGEREQRPVAARRRAWPAIAVAAAAVVAAAALSPPGRAVVDAVRRTIGIEHASPALFRLPSPGRLLVSGSGGTWVVSADGSKRRLGSYAQASWSPHGLFVVTATPTELAAVDPANGDVHWSLARRGIELPRWGGTRADTRLAYLSAGRLRVVAGDGTGDRVVVSSARVAPAWQPETHRLAYVSRRGDVAVIDADSGEVVHVYARIVGVRALAWSADGTQLAVASRRRLVVFGPLSHRQALPIAGVDALAFARDGRLGMIRGRAVLAVDAEGVQTLFTAPGRLAGLAWSPNGRWLATSLPSADQWIFVGGRRMLAVSHIARQLGGAVSLDGWMPGT